MYITSDVVQLVLHLVDVVHYTLVSSDVVHLVSSSVVQLLASSVVQLLYIVDVVHLVSSV